MPSCLRLTLLLTAMTFATGLSACGRAANQNPPAAAEITLAEAAAQIDSLQRPLEADPAEFEALRSGLKEQLASLGRLRWVSAVPQDNSSQVADLALARVDDISATATWTYRNQGDYNADGQVSVNDLAPIGIFFQSRSTDANWATAQSADGNADGLVSVNDLTPIGLNFQNSVDSYMIQISQTPEAESSWTPAGFALLSDSTQAAAGAPRTFSVSIPAALGFFYRVVPMYQGASGIPGLPVEYTGQAGGELSFDERKITMDLIAEKMHSLTTTTSNAQDIEIYSYILTLPHIEDAGFEEGAVWGRYDDGRVFIICKNLEPNPAGQASALRAPSALPDPPLPAAPVETAAPAAAPYFFSPRQTSLLGLPVGDLADLYHSFGPGTGMSNPIDDLAGILSDHGYTPYAREATVESIKVHNGGVFFLECHGDTAKGRDDLRQYFLSTGELVSREGEAAYHADLYAEPARLAHCYAWSARGDNDWTYCFSADFVRTYMSFSEGSLVFLNACNSSSVKAQPIVQAFHEVGASAVLGWNRTMPNDWIDAAARHFFDRSLGANQLSRQEMPPTRPFNYYEIISDMATRGVSAEGEFIRYPLRAPEAFAYAFLTHSIKGGPQAESFRLLAPTLAYMEVDEPNNQVLLSGEFGNYQDTVSIGGQSVEILSWGNNAILARLPAEGPGSAGDVYVEVRGHRSNTRRLTEWRGVVNYQSIGPGSLTHTAVFPMHLRGDVGDWRGMPDENPLLAGPAGTRFVSFQGSVDELATVSSSGTWFDPDSECTTTWTNGNQTIIPTSYETLPLGTPRWFNISFYDVDQHKFGFTGFEITAPLHSQVACGPSTEDQDTWFNANLVAVLQGGGFQPLEIPVNPDYSVSDAQLEDIVLDDVTYSISWNDWTVAYTPDLTAAR